MDARAQPRASTCPATFRLFGLLLALMIAPALAGEPAALMDKGNVAFRLGDLASAMAWYREAAEAGFAPAQAKLAFVLDHAEENEEAVAWFAKAAEQGNAEGQFGLARMLAAGEGIARDPAQALRWMKAAADQDFPPALSGLALWLEGGIKGIAADARDAARYWLRAAELGDHGAMQRLSVAHRKGELGLDPDEAKAQQWDARLRDATAAPRGKR